MKQENNSLVDNRQAGKKRRTLRELYRLEDKEKGKGKERKTPITKRLSESAPEANLRNHCFLWSLISIKATQSWKFLHIKNKVNDSLLKLSSCKLLFLLWFASTLLISLLFSFAPCLCLLQARLVSGAPDNPERIQLSIENCKRLILDIQAKLVSLSRVPVNSDKQIKV